MDTNTEQSPSSWPLWRKMVFRFLFVYFFFEIAPWTWLNGVPGFNFVIKYYLQVMDWLVHLGNAKLFHVREVLVPENGSGDTSWGWAELWLLLTLAGLGCLIWSVLDRKRANYTHLNYWLCLFVRYYIAYVAFIYGIEKVFAMQMLFPSLHQLATPLGDLLPMRFSWLFIGYSTPYQVFSGIMEVTAGLLLLWRRTASLGAFVATGVFINVMMLNLCYDIPVKIFSMQMVFLCLFLLLNESKRFVCFFILNKPADPCSIYHFEYTKKWMRISRIVLKLVFIVIAVGFQINNDWGYFKSVHKEVKQQAIKNGVYEVTGYSVNNTQLLPTDSMRWKDAVFENGTGSTVVADTSFRLRYGRAYFGFKADSAQHKITITKSLDGSVIYNFDYVLPDTGSVRLTGKTRQGDVVIDLKRTKRYFQLAEKQFHWLSEHNR